VPHPFPPRATKPPFSHFARKLVSFVVFPSFFSTRAVSCPSRRLPSPPEPCAPNIRLSYSRRGISLFHSSFLAFSFILPPMTFTGVPGLLASRSPSYMRVSLFSPPFGSRRWRNFFFFSVVPMSVYRCRPKNTSRSIEYFQSRSLAFAAHMSIK